MKVFQSSTGEPCKACGGVLARPGRFDICGDCLGSLSVMRFEAKHGSMTEATAPQWLAHKLRLDLSRVGRGLPTRRCEAISTYRSDLYQCACPALSRVNGRYVCGTHASGEFAFVGQREETAYKRLGALVSHLCAADSDLRAAILAALEPEGA